jgi:hypothetical protein
VETDDGTSFADVTSGAGGGLVKRFSKAIFSWKGLVALLFVLFFVVPTIESWMLVSLRENAIRTLEQRRGSRL